jgi:hypothetical protein
VQTSGNTISKKISKAKDSRQTNWQHIHLNKITAKTDAGKSLTLQTSNTPEESIPTTSPQHAPKPHSSISKASHASAQNHTKRHPD